MAQEGGSEGVKVAQWSSACVRCIRSGLFWPAANGQLCQFLGGLIMRTVSLRFSRKKTPNDNRYSRKQDVIRDCGYFAKTYINICYYRCMYVGSSKVPRIRPEPLEP